MSPRSRKASWGAHPRRPDSDQIWSVAYGKLPSLETRISRWAQALNGAPVALAGVMFLWWARMVVVLKGTGI